jgi:hypothetical protein
MTARSTHRKRRILPGFLVLLLMVLGQTTATPTLAASSNCAGISNASLSAGSWDTFSSPENPQYIGDALCYIIDNENDDDPQGKSFPTHSIDNFLFEHLGATNKNSHPLLLTASSGNIYRPAIYMLTERFRL